MIDCVDLGADVIVPHHILHAGIGGFPADHEHGHALRHRPAHEALLLVEIEDVEAVDPGREDDQRGRHHRVGGRAVLDQLIQRGLVDDLARGDRDVLAQLEGAGIGVAQLPAAQIGQQMLHPLDQIVAPRLERALKHHRIGQREIGRARRLGYRPGGEAQLLALVGGQALDPVDHLANTLSQEQISLMQQREGRVRAPARIGKTAITARQLRVALGSFTRLGAKAILPQHIFPQPEAFVPQHLLLLDIRQRHLPIPALCHRHPARGIEIGQHRLRIGQPLGLILQPHPLQLLAGLGPMLHVFHRDGTFLGATYHRRENCLGKLGLCLHRLGEGVECGLSPRSVDHSQFPPASKRTFVAA